MAMGAKVGSLNVDLTLETARFQKGLSQANTQLAASQSKFASFQKGIGSLGAALAGGAIVGALAGVASNAFEMASSLSETAAKVGVSVEALQELHFAAEQSGISSETMDKSIQRLNKSLGALQLGEKNATDAFKAIGLSADDLKGKTPDQALRLVADQLNKIPDAATRVALGQKIMGKSFSELLPLINGGSKALDENAKASRRNGQISTEDAKKLDDLADRWGRFKTRVGVVTANVIADTSTWLDETAALHNKFKARVDKFYADFGANIKALGKRVGEFFTMGGNMIAGLVHGIEAKATAVWNAIKGVVTGAIDKANKLLDINSPSRVFMEIGDYIGQGLATGIEGGKGKVAEATRKLTEAARQAAEETKALFARLFPELDAANKYGDELKLIDAARDPQTGQHLTDDAKSEARFRLGREFTGSTDALPIGLLNDPDANGERFQAAIDKVSEALGGFKDKAEVTTVAVAKSFADMVNATTQSLQQLAGALKGGGFLDILSAVIGLGTQLAGAGVFGKSLAARINAPRIPGNALGTNNWGGGLSWVGERGPELVDLPRGSRVIPNHRLGGIGGGNTYHFTGNLMTPEFWAMIHRGDVAAAQVGAQAGASMVSYRQRRRVG